MKHKVRLVGGPFEGDKAVLDGPLPPRLWVTPCPRCKTHWYDNPGPGEVYRKEEEVDRVWLYMFTDEQLSGDGGEARTTKGREKELAKA